MHLEGDQATLEVVETRVALCKWSGWSGALVREPVLRKMSLST